MQNKELKKYLNVIKRAVSLIEDMLENDDGGLLENLIEQPVAVAPVPFAQPVVDVPIPLTQPVIEVPVHQPVVPVQEIPLNIGLSETDLINLKLARKKHIRDLLDIDCWPESVPSFLMDKMVSEEDQKNKAKAVMDMMLDRSIDNCNFLDFGCGEGWIVAEALNRGVIQSIGYDIKSEKNWSSFQGTKFTTNIDDLESEFFDAIILYDVLDHCEDPVKIMDQVKRLLKKDGSVFVRCHPWTSKHANHIHKQGLNKAFFHLFLSYDEIKEITGENPLFTRIEKNPIEAYKWWFSRFNVKRERWVKERVSDFFFVPSFKDLLANEQQIPIDKINEFLKLMEVQFIDFSLNLKW